MHARRLDKPDRERHNLSRVSEKQWRIRDVIVEEEREQAHDDNDASGR